MDHPCPLEPAATIPPSAVFRPDFSGRGLWPWLMELCESNYLLLQSLCGKLSELPDCWTSTSKGVTLILRSSHLSPYTSDFSYVFDLRETLFQIHARLYHDARICDAYGVLCSQLRGGERLPGILPHARPGRDGTASTMRGLDLQWRDNCVMRRWLEYAFTHGHFAMRSLGSSRK